MTRPSTRSLSSTLAVSMTTSAAEGDGTLSSQGVVTASAAVDSDVVITLIADDTSEVTVPSFVTMASGQTSTTFDVTIIDDDAIDGVQDDLQLAEHLIVNAGVALVPGTAFGLGGHARISIATSMENLEKALDRIEGAIG